jgi:hypothetical protein
MTSFEEIFEQHIIWVKKTFPLSTSEGALLHAEREIKEVKECKTKEEKRKEYVDILGCLIDAVARDKITMLEFKIDFINKLEINKERKWTYNGDGSYSHIKPKQ